MDTWHDFCDVESSPLAAYSIAFNENYLAWELYRHDEIIYWVVILPLLHICWAMFF